MRGYAQSVQYHIIAESRVHLTCKCRHDFSTITLFWDIYSNLMNKSNINGFFYIWNLKRVPKLG